MTPWASEDFFKYSNNIQERNAIQLNSEYSFDIWYTVKIGKWIRLDHIQILFSQKRMTFLLPKYWKHKSICTYINIVYILMCACIFFDHSGNISSMKWKYESWILFICTITYPQNRTFKQIIKSPHSYTIWNFIFQHSRSHPFIPNPSIHTVALCL